jgi:hypothetical protein
MANLDVVDRIENADTGTLTLVVKDRDNAEDLGAYYHYAAVPPAHANVKPDQWAEQVAAHALALEARARGIEPPARAHPEPGQLGAAPAGEQLADEDQAELEQLRAARASADQVARDRAELEQLRAERAAHQEQPTA